MKEIQISEETYRSLLVLKNHWSFTYRKITNKEVIQRLESLKKETFGYDSTATDEEIERISCEKTRDQLERESERFQQGYRGLLGSGLDFEPKYTMDQHLKKMIELIEEGEEIGTPLF